MCTFFSYLEEQILGEKDADCECPLDKAALGHVGTWSALLFFSSFLPLILSPFVM